LRLHPNDAGYKAMAEAIDLKIFTAKKWQRLEPHKHKGHEVFNASCPFLVFVVPT
jgi:hypothetical protein